MQVSQKPRAVGVLGGRRGKGQGSGIGRAGMLLHGNGMPQVGRLQGGGVAGAAVAGRVKK